MTKGIIGIPAANIDIVLLIAPMKIIRQMERKTALCFSIDGIIDNKTIPNPNHIPQ